MLKEKLVEILGFFDPVQLKHFKNSSFINDEGCIGKSLLINSLVEPLTQNERFDIAIFGVNQYFNNDDKKKANVPQLIREELYRLKKNSAPLRIADFGNLKTGENFKETLFALEHVCSLFFHLNKTLLIIGGDQLLTVANFKALKEFENNINLAHIDSKIDLATSIDSIKERHYLNTIIENEASYLYNVSCIGYQSYFADQKQLEYLNKQYFEHFRLGLIRNKFENIEPAVRDADLVSFDISAVRMSEAPAQTDGSPNGFYADEACRLSRYIGLSDRVKAFGLYEIDARFDQNSSTNKLAAQIIWHFLDGFINRKRDFPDEKSINFTKFEVQIDEIDFPIVFFKSQKSERWWLEVKSMPNKEHSHKSVIVPCSEDDYNSACRNEIPERWWINFKKLK
jgi:arginase family enzyme